MWEFNKKPEPTTQVVKVAEGLSQEERELQHKKIAQLDYIAWLLERLVWLAAPGNKEFPDYQILLKEFYKDHLNAI